MVNKGKNSAKISLQLCAIPMSALTYYFLSNLVDAAFLPSMTPLEGALSEIFHMIAEITNICGILLEAPVLLFLFKEFTHKHSPFRTAYFIILSYGYFVDLVCFSPFWMSKKINQGNNFLAVPFGIAEWYSDFWYCFWNLMLAFNRATAVWVPFQHSQVSYFRYITCLREGGVENPCNNL